MREVLSTKRRRNNIKFGDRFLYGCTTFFLVLLLVAVAYPIIYVISASFSSTTALTAGKVFLWPVDCTLNGYRFIMKYKMVWTGYRNTIIYTLVGVAISLTVQILFAYPLARKDYQGRGAITKMFVFAMMTNPGLIPNFLTRVNYGLYGSPWAVLLGGLISMSTITILRTSFAAVPEELHEAASMDGAGHLWRLMRVTIPLSKATLGVMCLYAAVAYWNNYFDAMIYLQDENLYPLALVLRSILSAAGDLEHTTSGSADMRALLTNDVQSVKYGLIVISTVPIVALYFGVQKCFQSGVMVGAVKG